MKRNKIRNVLTRPACFGVFFLLISTYCLLGAQKNSSPLLRQIQKLSTCMVPMMNSSLGEPKKYYSSTLNDSGKQCSIPEESSRLFSQSTKQKEQLELITKYELLFKQCKNLLQEVTDTLGKYRQKNEQPEKRSKYANRNPAVIQPINGENIDFPQPHLLLSVQKPESRLKESTTNSAIRSELPNLESSNISQTVEQRIDDFLNRIIKNVSDPSKINQCDLRSIINLYSSLVFCNKDGITKVLNGQTNTGKSQIYNQVIAHIKSRDSDIDTYRTIYTSLQYSLGDDFMNVVYKTVEQIEKERINLLTSIYKKERATQQEYISMLVEGAHPLHPIEFNEVKGLLDLYVSLSNRPRDGITKVLNGQTNIGKSAIYNDVNQYITQQASDLETYRNIYARVNKSLKNNGIKALYHIISKNIVPDLEQNEAPLQKKVFTIEQSEEIKPVVPENQLIDRHCATNPLLDNQGDDRRYVAANSSDNFLKTADGKYKISKKEQDRLNRIYGLLPEYHGKSITGVLASTTTNTDLPVWKDVQQAIEQIKREAEKEGDKTIIDLSYFRKLHWLSIRVTGNPGFRERKNSDEEKVKKSSIGSNKKKIKNKIPSKKSSTWSIRKK